MSGRYCLAEEISNPYLDKKRSWQGRFFMQIIEKKHLNCHIILTPDVKHNKINVQAEAET